MSSGGGAVWRLLGLVGELAERGLKADYRSVWTFVHDEKLSFKRKRGSCPLVRIKRTVIRHWRDGPPASLRQTIS